MREDGRLRALVAVDDQLCECSSATEALATALELRRERPSRQIGLALGELAPPDDQLVGAAVAWAQRARDHAAPGTLCMTEAFVEAYGDTLSVRELGMVSFAGYAERVRLFLAGPIVNYDYEVLAIDLVEHAMIANVGEDTEPRYEERWLTYDRAVFAMATAIGGVVLSADEQMYVLALRDTGAGLRAARFLQDRWEEDGRGIGNLRFGLANGPLRWRAGRRLGDAVARARLLTSRSDYRVIAVARDPDPDLAVPLELETLERRWPNKPFTFTRLPIRKDA